MNSEERIVSILAKHNVLASGRIVEDIFTHDLYYVFVDVVRNHDNHQIPSNKTLDRIREECKTNKLNIEFVLTDSQSKDIEAGYRASIMHSFGDYVRNAFLTLESDGAIGWIAPKKEISIDIIPEIEERSRIFLSNYDILLYGLEFTSAANLPGKLACLRTLRVLAPLTALDLTDALRKKGFSVPSENWTTRILDSLRKGGLVMRRKSGHYVVTLAGLKSIGTQKNRNSADITRMLALARAGE